MQLMGLGERKDRRKHCLGRYLLLKLLPFQTNGRIVPKQGKHRLSLAQGRFIVSTALFSTGFGLAVKRS